nr:serine/threonine-protein kinase atm [Quercus suber]
METDDDLETNLEDSQDECEGNKDATHALMRVKQKLDGYEEGEMRNVRGQHTKGFCFFPAKSYTNETPM